MRQRIAQLARMDLTGLRGLYLSFEVTQGRGTFEVISGGWVPSPAGRIPIVPWDRDKLITKICEYEGV